VASTLLLIDIPIIDSHIDTPPEAAISIIMLLYFTAAMINLKIPDTGVVYENINKNPFKLISNFAHCFKVLWKDRLGQISLAVTTLFWGIGATLQFIILSGQKVLWRWIYHEMRSCKQLLLLVLLEGLFGLRQESVKKISCCFEIRSNYGLFRNYFSQFSNPSIW
jgi:hypothetical protein